MLNKSLSQFFQFPIVQRELLIHFFIPQIISFLMYQKSEGTLNNYSLRVNYGHTFHIHHFISSSPFNDAETVTISQRRIMWFREVMYPIRDHGLTDLTMCMSDCHAIKRVLFSVGLLWFGIFPPAVQYQIWLFSDPRMKYLRILDK